jgi:hypothetical protein
VAFTIDISCTDPDGNPLTYLRGNPGNGTVSNQTTVSQASGPSPFLQGPGILRFTYTPRFDYFGSDSIAFLAADGRGGTSNTALLSITVSSAPTPVPPAPVLAQNPPDVLSFSIAPKRFSVGRGSTATTAATGGTFTYSLSAPARVQIEIERQAKGRRSRGRCSRTARRGARCTLYQFKGTLTRNGNAGTNTVPFTGRIGRKPLPRGTYLATITPFDAAGEAGVPQTTTFKIVARSRSRR